MARKIWPAQASPGRRFRRPAVLAGCLALLLAAAQPVIARSLQAALPVRPQEPVRPYPYRERQVRFVNRANVDKVRLAGTLTLPRGKGPFPAVILIAGAGSSDRDESAAGHKPFLVLSDHLTRKGIAVLRFDERGVGASTGDHARAAIDDLVGDVRAGLAYLRGRRDVDARRIGLIGHSEGGLIAPRVAIDEPGVAFVVLMAGPGENGSRIALRQGELILRADGKSESAIVRSTTIRRAIFDIVREEPDAARRDAALRTRLAAPDMAPRYGLSPAEIDVLIETFSTDFFHFILNYDPAPTLARLRQPVLAIAGSLDLQVPPTENLAAIRAALGRGSDVTVAELPGLNHLFQTARTGSPAEYQSIEETIAPVALNSISDWILARVAGKTGSTWPSRF